MQNSDIVTAEFCHKHFLLYAKKKPNKKKLLVNYNRKIKMKCNVKKNERKLVKYVYEYSPVRDIVRTYVILKIPSYKMYEFSQYVLKFLRVLE